MKLRELFEKDIDRNINGVVQVEQVNDDDILETELKEFVVTKELTRHFRTLYRNYNSSLEVKTKKNGVWISGFFGSGKSHFLKMLSYLLENKEIKGIKAVDYFDGKFEDETIYGDIKRAATVPTETILFNIDSKSSADSKAKNSGIADVFLKVFNNKLGYSANFPRLANIERHLDKFGKYEEFKTLVTNDLGLEWKEAVDGVEFYKDSFINSYIKLEGCSEQTARELFENVVEDYSITPENLANLVMEYLKSKGEKDRIIFLVDEVGQFISDNSDLMLNMQTVTEKLGDTCNGRVWVFVTSQEAIDTITKERFKDKDFSKIQGRYDTKLSLSGANTDEVIKRRLLVKKDVAKDSLAIAYKDKEKILDNLIRFSSQTAGMRTYNGEVDFVECYPFVPYQFKLLQDVFASLRNFSHAGAHLSENERSMLNAFHAALQEFGDKEVNELVPFNIFYSTIKNFIDTNIVRIIDQAKYNNHDLEDFDVEVLIVLFLIKYIKEVPSDLENLATLMISNIDDNKIKLKEKISASLARLKKAMLIQQNGEEYDFLTDEEQDISRGIERVSIDNDDITNEIYNGIFREILDTKNSIAISNNNLKYYTCQVDDKKSKEEDIGINIITSMNPKYEVLENERNYYSNPTVLVIKLKDNGYLSEIQTILKTNKFCQKKTNEKQTELQTRILIAKGQEVLDRKSRVKKLLEQALMESKYFTNSESIEVSGTTAASKIADGLKKVALNTYPKLSLIQENIKDERELLQKINSKQVRTINPNEKALEDLRGYLDTNNTFNMPVTMQTLVNKRYSIPQYGWTIYDIAGLVVDLMKSNEVTVDFNGAGVRLENSELVKYLTNIKNLASTVVKLKTKVDTSKLREVKDIAIELFDKQDFDSEDDEKLERQLKERLADFINDINGVLGKYTNPKYPQRDFVKSGLDTFKILKGEVDINALFDGFIEKKDELIQWKNDYRRVKSFFDGNQVKYFDEADTLSKRYKDNEVFISDCDKKDQLKSDVEKIDNILSMEIPYSDIKDLPMLIGNFNTLYGELVQEFKNGIESNVKSCRETVKQEAEKYKLNVDEYTNMYDISVTNKFETSNDFAQLKGLKDQSENTKRSLLKRITDDASEQTPSNSDEPLVEVKKFEYINPIEFVKSEFLETEQDVDDYINRLSVALQEQIRANKKVGLKST